ncbi:MAG: hypothetical protein Q8O30_02530 [Candidatus Omnitrophota bacterium]|nr:hypothetical protein [Candidatus Omnitrophota bacterium]
MRERNFDIKLAFFSSAILIFIIFLSFFLCSNTKANFFYEKTAIENKPTVEAAKLDYYKHAIFLLTQAIRLNSGEADYWTKKADYLLGALDDNFKEALAINEAEVEDSYKKAIILNPLNYEYHLKLGWFYANKGDIKLAEDELLKAAQLHPTNFQVYLYLGKYYIKTKAEGKAFNNFILAIYYAGKCNWRMFTKAIKQDINNSSILFLDEKAEEIKLIILHTNSDFSFKNQGLPHEQIPLRIKAYVRKGVGGVSLTCKGDSYRFLHWVDSTPELEAYELSLDTFAQNVYLDDFEIRTNPPVNIEKIEFIYKF